MIKWKKYHQHGNSQKLLIYPWDGFKGHKNGNKGKLRWILDNWEDKNNFRECKGGRCFIQRTNDKLMINFFSVLFYDPQALHIFWPLIQTCFLSSLPVCPGITNTFFYLSFAWLILRKHIHRLVRLLKPRRFLKYVWSFISLYRPNYEM